MLPGSRALISAPARLGVSGVGPRPLTGVGTHWGTLGLAPRQLGRLSGLGLTQGFRYEPLDSSQRGFR